MQNNKFLKLTSFVLSISTWLSSFAIIPSYAQGDISLAKRNINLSKKAKIGIAGASVLGVGALLTTIWLCSRHRDDENKIDNALEFVLAEMESMTGERRCAVSRETAEGWLNKWNPAFYDWLHQIILSKLSEDYTIHVNAVKDTGAEEELDFPDKNKDPDYKLYAHDIEASKEELKRFAGYCVWLVNNDYGNHPSKPFPELSLPEPTRATSIPHELEESQSHLLSVPEVVTREGAGVLSGNNTWEKLRSALSNDERLIQYVRENYSEWEDRLTDTSGARRRLPYGKICSSNGDRLGDYENFALRSIARSLQMAARENYRAQDPSNNELLCGLPAINRPPRVHLCSVQERLKRITVEREDILECMYKRRSMRKKMAALNAGDPYDPNGFLPNHGAALEEYLSMMTTLIRDLSHNAFRVGHPNSINGGFYTDRNSYPPIAMGSRDIPGAWQRLQSALREGPYKHRGIMSKHVRMIRPLFQNAFRDPRANELTFLNGSEGGFYGQEFLVLSIAGLEDRSKSLLLRGGDGHTAEEYQRAWKNYTKEQCRFVLHAFINEGVDVPFLCAFGAGCFGGSAMLVAECFRELLVDEGYADYFDEVVFPIIGGQDLLNRSKSNYDSFREVFQEGYQSQFGEVVSASS